MKYKVGDELIMTTGIIEDGEDLPPHCIAEKGDTVFVQRVWLGRARIYCVAHENNCGGFWAAENELRPQGE